MVSTPVALDKYVRKTERLLRFLSRGLADTEDPQQIARRFASISRNLLAADSALVWEKHQNKEKVFLHAAAADGVQLTTKLVMPADSDQYVGQVATLGRSLVVDSVDPKACYHPMLVKRMDWRSALAVPVTVRNNATWGVVSVYATRSAAFSRLDLLALEAIGQRMAVHLELADIKRTGVEKVMKEIPTVSAGLLAMESCHDMGHALNDINSYFSLIQNIIPKNLKTGQKTLIDAFTEDLDFLATAIKELTSLGRLERTDFRTNRLGDIIAEVEKFVGPSLERKRIALVVRHEDRDLEVFCDRQQVKRVVHNLLSNAQYFVGLTKRKKGISVRTRKTNDGMWEIIVEDNGTGIDPLEKSRIFDLYYTTKGSERTMGFGLAICQRIVEENHSGAILVDSKWGSGTRFTVRIPFDLSRTKKRGANNGE